MSQLNEQINRTMEIIIKDAERASLLHISDGKLAEVLMKEYKQPPLEYAEDARTMTQAIIHASQLNPYILSISYHGKNGNIYSSAGSTEDYNIYSHDQNVNWVGFLFHSGCASRKVKKQSAVRLKESIVREYISQMNARKVEPKMLQAQINPHFLYNTLNLISSIADLEGVEKISAISNSLSDMFRNNIKGKEVLPIKDELEQIKNDLTLQELRFPGKFTVDYDIDPSVCNCSVLKFLMQPIVENAVYHGIEQMKGKGRIRISVKPDEDTLYIDIEDNGKGVDPLKLAKIKNKINEMKRGTTKRSIFSWGHQASNALPRHEPIIPYRLPLFA